MAMFGYAELSLLDLPPDSPVRSKIKSVLDAGARARDLIRQILTFSRSSESVHQPVEIRLIVREALRLLRATIPSTITIRERLDTAGGYVSGDSTQIYQVVMNLCTNAAHAMEADGGILTVAVDNLELAPQEASRYLGLQPGRHIRLQVSDSGHGMDARTLEHLFEPFFTTKAQGKGTGLGLAVVHGIVKSHKGAIHVQSAPEEGTTITIFLPHITPTDRPQSLPCPDAHRPGSHSAGGR